MYVSVFMGPVTRAWVMFQTGVCTRVAYGEVVESGNGVQLPTSLRSGVRLNYSIFTFPRFAARWQVLAQCAHCPRVA